jgi:hypothetical protein
MIRRCGRTPPHRGSSRRTAAVNRSRPSRRTRLRSPAHRTRHHGQRRAPAHRPERAPRRGQHRRPRAFGQITDLVHRRRRGGRQPAAARPQVPQPRPYRIGALRLITAQLAGQPRDQHRVLGVRLVPGSGPRPPGPGRPSSSCTHTNARPPPGRELIQDPPPVPGRLARHRHRREPRPGRPARCPVQHLAQLPGPGTDPAAGDHPRIMIRHHRSLGIVSQVDPHDRVAERNQLTQPRQPRVAVAVSPGQATTAAYGRPP